MQRYPADIDTAIEKLPKWAQAHIRQLQMQRRELVAKVNTLFLTTPTNTAWGEGNSTRFLPNGSRIEFWLPGKVRNDLSISVRVDDYGLLDINANSSITIYPRASNHILIAAKEE